MSGLGSRQDSKEIEIGVDLSVREFKVGGDG
jgi:hypothetical protein